MIKKARTVKLVQDGEIVLHYERINQGKFKAVHEDTVHYEVTERSLATLIETHIRIDGTVSVVGDTITITTARP